ncbi:Transferase [Halomicronema hongdechloris C2206]|uniref:Transferase n=1 Tax=Halomicronema hongdechloris C2206 TaxID=1641165 RepID=A0A1Z3HKC2_9CYAN|nr:hypothetical protein [Halomicronema hongdechloris]ASC70706.1 Transferase [Halomicronema hongdechloris C2206]
MSDWFPSQLSHGSEYYLHGPVEVEPGAIIAAGVVLEAAANASLVIQSGVCIGKGVIIQAWQGTLTIEADANLGSDVVVVGQGQIGTRACIGAESTIINPAIASEQVVPANSLLGGWQQSAACGYRPALHQRSPSPLSQRLRLPRPHLPMGLLPRRG